MSFRSLIEPVANRPKGQSSNAAAGLVFLRDQLSISTWLAVGALVQGLLFLLIGRLALIPVVFLLGYRVADTWLITIGWRKNTYMDGVIPSKFSAQIPDENGNFSGKPADSQVVVFLLGTRSNHPLGPLAPGFKTMGDYFSQMTKDLEQHADEFGYLGMTSWLSQTQRESKNELMNVCYFRTFDGLHKFAHSPYHRDAWRWFNKEVKSIPHLSLWHETFVVPKGHWETIYLNSHPGHMGSTSFKITDEKTGEEKWASPVVDATRGLLRTSKGRMSRSDATENDGYEKNALF